MPKQISQLLDILNQANPAKRVLAVHAADRGLAEAPHYPLLALVGQVEMKLALVLNLINPMIGGVLLIGPRGTGKTTAVRGLIDLLPQVLRARSGVGAGHRGDLRGVRRETGTRRTHHRARSHAAGGTAAERAPGRCDWRP